MTPQVIGYTVGEFNGNPVHIELSKGRGLSPGGNPVLYGVSFRRPGGGEIWREKGVKDPSTCFDTKIEALDYIEKFGGDRYLFSK